MKKKGVVSILLIVTIIASVFSLSAASASAAKLAKPSLTVTQQSNGVGIKWTNLNGAQAYALYIGTGNNWLAWRKISANEYNQCLTKFGHFPLYKQTLTDGRLNRPHTTQKLTYGITLSSGTQYRFQVVAINSNNGIAGHWSSVVNLTYLSTPTITVNSNADGIRISWARISGANEYQVAKIMNGKWTELKVVKNLYCVDTSVTRDQSYSYRILARINSGGKIIAKSCVSNTITAKYITVKYVNNSKDIEVKWDGYTSTGKYGVRFVFPDGVKFDYNGKTYNKIDVTLNTSTKSILLKNVSKPSQYGHLLSVAVYACDSKGNKTNTIIAKAKSFYLR